MILRLAQERGPAKSICPSDAARAVGGESWRDLMDQARDVARELARQGDVEITQGGAVLDADAAWRGPIRIRIREQ
ncbi:S-adenosylmethionine tRNA ribosyltransferase [Mycobacterium sp. 1274761.0]|nr:S-adenosylmethionine tRNA ribosyltransferase [Mycobacterium sp. 1274761.0]